MPQTLYKAVYCFDVDDTLAIQGSPFPGPVTMNDVARLRSERCITGICGNFQVLFRFFPDWWQYFSFYGPTKLITPRVAAHAYKHMQLNDIRQDLVAERYIMVGNRRGDPKVRPHSQDDVQAKLAGWEFIDETSFSRGKR